MSAWNLAEAAEAAGDVRAAFRYYAILYLVGIETEEIRERKTDAWKQAGCLVEVEDRGYRERLLR